MTEEKEVPERITVELVHPKGGRIGVDSEDESQLLQRANEGWMTVNDYRKFCVENPDVIEGFQGQKAQKKGAYAEGKKGKQMEVDVTLPEPEPVPELEFQPDQEEDPQG